MSLPEFIKNRKVLLRIIVCMIAVGGLYWQVVWSMANDWYNLPDFSHGFFIPLLSLYFVWERAGRLDNTPVMPTNHGLVVLLLGLFLFFLGNLASESFMMRFSLLVVLSGITLFLLGWAHFRTLIFPIGFLIFMIPLPSILMLKITFPLQLLASRAAAFSLHLFNIPVLREGNVIHLTNTNLEVAEACSGIRSLISLLALGTVIAYFTKKFFWQRATLVLLCVPIAIIVNALRVSATGILAHYFGPSVAEGFYHEFSGYILFIAAFALLVGVSTLMGRMIHATR